MTEPPVLTGHWQRAYVRNGDTGVSWYAPDAAAVLAMITHLAVPRSGLVVDVGGGSSRLVDGLLEHGFTRIVVLDLAAHALELTRQRLGERAGDVELVAGDLRAWRPAEPAVLWHDRAVLHFFVAEADRAAYRASLTAATAPGSVVILATFAPDGPAQCSGLPVRRYSAQELIDFVGDGFEFLESSAEQHRTPAGAHQPFTRVVLRRTA